MNTRHIIVGHSVNGVMRISLVFRSNVMYNDIPRKRLNLSNSPESPLEKKGSFTQFKAK